MTYRPEIETAAAAHGLDPDLVQAVVEQESGYKFFAYRFEPGFFTRYLAHKPEYANRNPLEVSASIGLMQTMFTTAVEAGYTGEPWGLFEPAVSLEFGCRILKSNLEWARGVYVGMASLAERKIRMSALAAYNGGRGGNAPDGVLDRNHGYADAVIERYVRISRLRQRLT
jgi:soluble lytic murein transglycosylase-like protein